MGCGEIRRLGVEKAYLRQRRKGAKKLMPKDFAGRRSATLQIRTLRSDGRGSAVVGAAVVCFIFKGHSHAPIYEGIVAGRISGCLARDARGRGRRFPEEPGSRVVELEGRIRERTSRKDQHHRHEAEHRGLPEERPPFEGPGGEATERRVPVLEQLDSGLEATGDPLVVAPHRARPRLESIHAALTSRVPTPRSSSARRNSRCRPRARNGCARCTNYSRRRWSSVRYRSRPSTRER